MTRGKTVTSSIYRAVETDGSARQDVEDRLLPLVHRQKDLLVDFLFQMTGSQERAIEWGLQTAAKLGRAPGRSDPRMWLLKEATRRVAREERSERMRHTLFPWTRRRSVKPAFEEGITPGGGVVAWERLEKERVVREALAAVRPELRRLLVLRDILGVAVEETASLAGVSVPQLQDRLDRARLIFRTSISRIRGD